MPTVPTVDGPSVQENAAPNAYQTTPSGLGGAGMVRAQQLDQASQTAGAFATMQQRQQELADQVRVDDAINRAKERQIDLTFGKDTGFTYQKGINALQRDSGRPLAEEYGDQFKNTLSEITNGLGNERQKRAFQMRANDMLTGFKSQVMQHEGQEFQNYSMSVREGTIENRKREVGLYYNDPSKVDEALASIQAAVTDMGRNLGGKSAEWIEARARKETSNALTVALGAALERNDVAYADGFLKKYGDRMDADDLLKARGLIDKQLDAGVALKTATDVVRSVQPRVQPSDFDRFANITGDVDMSKMVGITVKSESGGDPNAVSPKGAKGVMQVMDGTNAAPGFGVTPAKDDSPAERARVGRDYLAAMVKRYNGNIGQAWAAYNAGPGAVDKALKDGGDWLAKMPAETQAYVAKNLAAYGQGEGRPPAPTLQDVHDAVRAQIGDGKPARLKLALDEATRQWEDMQKAVKQRDENATAEAQRWLAANDGRFSLLPASLRSRVPPGEVDNLIGYGQKIARGEDRTEPNWYQKFSDQGFLKSLNDDQFYTLSTRYLSEADRKHFADERGKLLTGPGVTDKPGDLSSGAIKSVLDTRLRELNIDPSPKDDGGADAARIGAIRQYVDRSVLQAQAAAGKKFSDAEVAKHIDSLFAQTDTVNSWLGLSSKSAPMLTMKAGDIPGPVRDRLAADFKAAGVDAPTDAQLLGAYFQAKNAQAQRRKLVPLSAAKPAGATGNF
jgi:soluble lytic murein transglycosylase